MNGSDVAFLLSADVGRFAAAFRAEFGSDLVPLTRHSLNDFFGHGRAVLAALEPFIEQFDTEALDLFSSAFRDLLFDRAAAQLDVRQIGGQDRSRLL